MTTIQLVIGCFALVICWVYVRWPTRAIPGIPVAPGLPLVGNTFQVLHNPALQFILWHHQLKSSLFQIRLGTRWVVVANSYQDVSGLLLKNLSALASRPVSFTFHNIVSATQGATIGSTPAGESYQRKKKTIAEALNKRAIDDMLDLLDAETKYTIVAMLRNTGCYDVVRTRLSDVNLLEYGQMFSLRTSTLAAYGVPLDVFGHDKALARRIVKTESHIIKLRLPVSNLQDHVPLLRVWPFAWFANGKSAEYWRTQRDKYMRRLMAMMKHRIERGNVTASTSIVGQLVLTNRRQLLTAEIDSVCLTLVSAGLDNTSLNFNHIMGHLSKRGYGYDIQTTAHRLLMEAAGNNQVKAWKDTRIMGCDYIKAIVQEGLRFFTVLPLGLPRETTRPITYNNVIIPRGTMVLCNTYAANHDPSQFARPYTFDVSRWLVNGKFTPLTSFEFGAGARKCLGAQFAFRELYMLVARMILVFKIRAPIDAADSMNPNPFISNACPSAPSFEPGEFKVRLVVRNTGLVNHIRK